MRPVSHGESHGAPPVTAAGEAERSRWRSCETRGSPGASCGGSTMKTVRAGHPIVVDDLQIIPVESIEVVADQALGGLMAVATQEPVAIVVRRAGREWALDLEGREITLSDLLDNVEGLQETMSGAKTMAG